MFAELKQLARGSMVSKRWGQYSNLGLPDPKPADLNNLEGQCSKGTWTSASMALGFASHLFLQAALRVDWVSIKGPTGPST